MPGIIPIIVGLIPAGIQLEQFLQGLFTAQKQLQVPNRPDVSDETRAMLSQLIDAVQEKINADAAKQA